MTNLTELVRHPYIAGTIAHQEALDALVAEIKVRKDELANLRELRILQERLMSVRCRISEEAERRIWHDYRRDWLALSDERGRREAALRDAHVFVDREV
jgi:hypothetical protein